MPPIPVYSASPINASKGAGGTPRTRVPEERPEDHDASEGRASEARAGSGATSVTSGGQPSTGLAPRPGAQPPMPAQTGAPLPSASSRTHPTPTIDAGPLPVGEAGPPAPQPGAVPVSPGLERQIPPPPKAGESAEHYRQAEPVTTAPARLPPQMAYHAPAATHAIQGRSSTSTTMPTAQCGGPYPTPLAGTGSDVGYATPLGYQQGAGASELNRYQGQGQDIGGSRHSGNWSSVGGDDQPGVWDTARKWASAAGESLAAAESEVWKKINKS